MHNLRVHDFPYTVALTGGIASGKSAAADCFAALGASVIDADMVARELVAPGGPVLAQITATFGSDVLDPSGTLDRRAMRERVFANPDARAQLNAILHPRVRVALHDQAAMATGPYVILVIPLLVESGSYDWVDRVLVVDVPRDLQRARLLARDGIPPELADAMLDAQASREQRLAVADDLIPNEDSLAEMHARVLALHAHYLALAERKSFGADQG